MEAQWYFKLVSTHANCTPLICYINVKVINIEATEEKRLMFCTFRVLDSLGDDMTWEMKHYIWLSLEIKICIILFRGNLGKKILQKHDL